jgi:hypothetical protein
MMQLWSDYLDKLKAGTDDLPLAGNAGLAQTVEHLICNQGVAGSIPAAGTNKRRDL